MANLLHFRRRGRRIASGAFFLVWGTCFFCGGIAKAQTGTANLRLQVIDEDGQPLPRVEVTLHIDGGAMQTSYSDAAGKIDVRNLEATRLQVEVSKPGFFRIKDRELELKPGVNEVSLTLNHETELKQQLEVLSTPIQIDPDSTGHKESLVQHEITNTPVASSHDLQQSLRTMPQVVATGNGVLHVAGGRQGQTEVLLDGFEVNDPATGAFNSRVNVDAVRNVTIETGGYGAAYAHASAGTITLDTQSGDDHWRFGATNFIPELSFQQGTHFGNWYPRLTFSGPISKGKAWFSEAFTLQHTFRLVKELPQGQNTETQWLADNLLRGQVNLSPRNVLQGSFLLNRFNNPRQNLGAFTPLSTTVSNNAQRYFGSLKDQIWFGRTLFEIGVAADNINATTNPQGTATYVIMSSSATGNYFQALEQHSRRLQFIGDATSGNLSWFGTHTLSAGWNADGLEFSQQARRTQIDFLRSDGTLAERATFSGPTQFRLANTQIGGYIQDLWRPWKPIVFSIGVRSDWDRLIQQHMVEPRIAMTWVPDKDGCMKFTLAWGKHYQPLSLATIGQGFDQSRSDLFFDATGLMPTGPPIVSSFIVPLRGLAQPRSYNTTAEWDAKISAKTFAGAAFLLRESRDGLAWESMPNGSLLLQNSRNDRYIAGEVWVRHVFNERAEFQVDYTRSRASSNEVLDPTLAVLILAPQQPGPLLWDTPNRVVSSGWTPIPIWSLLLSGFFEYRTGFPFSAVNEQQQLVGAPNRLRFPVYIDLNLGLEKRFHFRGHEWGIRVAAVNITGHRNPDSVANNVNAPNYLTFAGGQSRAFTARIRLVTEH